MTKYKIKYKYIYEVEVDAENIVDALEMGERIMVMREESGDLGAPVDFEEEIEVIQ